MALRDAARTVPTLEALLLAETGPVMLPVISGRSDGSSNFVPLVLWPFWGRCAEASKSPESQDPMSRFPRPGAQRGFEHSPVSSTNSYSFELQPKVGSRWNGGI